MMMFPFSGMSTIDWIYLLSQITIDRHDSNNMLVTHCHQLIVVGMDSGYFGFRGWWLDLQQAVQTDANQSWSDLNDQNK